MSDTIQGGVQSAGTRFPFINLEKAIGRAQQLFDADQKGREMPVASVFAAWEYSEKSSGGFQTIAALKMYGLISTSAGDGRRIALSESGLRYFRDEREDEKMKLAREFALRPKLIAALWEQWGDTPPSDAVARSHLKAERGLTDQGARSLLAIYKENLVFAELKGSVLDSQSVEEAPAVRPSTPTETFDEIFGRTNQQKMQQAPQVIAPPQVVSAMPEAVTENDIKIMLDGDRLRVSAYVNLKGAKRLLKALQANMALLEDEDDEKASNILD